MDPAKIPPAALTIGIPAVVVIGAYLLKPKLIMDSCDPKKISNTRLLILAVVAILAGQVADCVVHKNRHEAVADWQSL